jgi:signal peptidase I
VHGGIERVPPWSLGGRVEQSNQNYRPRPKFPEPEMSTSASPEELEVHDGRPGELPASERQQRATAWEIIETILLALLIFVMVRGVVLNFRVDGNSMEPTLHNAEMLIVNRRAYFSFDQNAILSVLPGVERAEANERYLFNPPKRGDIIVFRPPGGRTEPYIKRIIGLPGEQVEINNGTVYVNGTPLDEPYVSSSTTWRGGGEGSSLVVPEGEYFVLGDNRSNSSDSRVFGTVPMGNIIGKAWIAYWPPSSIQVLPRPAYALE